MLPKIFETLAARYRERQGGYTRIHRFGRRTGDAAPAAILTLVDGPKDIRFEMLARRVGREAAQAQLLGEGEVIRGGLNDWMKAIHDGTRREVMQSLKFRNEEDRKMFESRTREFAVSTIKSEAGEVHREESMLIHRRRTSCRRKN